MGIVLAIVLSFFFSLPVQNGEQGSVVAGEQGSVSLSESGVVHPW
jgi:hypothetical protein